MPAPSALPSTGGGAARAGPPLLRGTQRGSGLGVPTAHLPAPACLVGYLPVCSHPQPQPGSCRKRFGALFGALQPRTDGTRRQRRGQGGCGEAALAAPQRCYLAPKPHRRRSALPGAVHTAFLLAKNGENSGKTARGHRAPARQGATPPLKHRGGEGEGKNYKQEEKKERGRDPGGCRGSAVTHGSSRFAARRLSALTGSSAAAPPPPSLPA